MVAKLKSGAPLVASKEPAPAPVDKEPPVVDKPPKPERPKKGREHADRDPELATVKLPPQPVKKDATPVPAGGGAVGGSAMALYKAKDFAAAEKAMRQESVSQPQKQFQKTIETANQIRQLKQVVDRASGEEGTKPDLAIKDYEEALALDAKLGHGMHAAFFKGKVGKLQQSFGLQAFGQGKFDVAFAAAKEAARSGAGDGGLMKQLENKAADLVQKGQAVQKSNVVQAKQYWRTVIKMVPNTSANYAKAYQLLNNAGGPHRDEDED